MSGLPAAASRRRLPVASDPALQIVRVERVLFDGTQTTEYLGAFSAALEAVAGEANGRTVRSLRVVWGDVIDEWTRSA